MPGRLTTGAAFGRIRGMSNDFLVKRLGLLALFGASACWAARPDWSRYVIFEKGADYEVKSVSPAEFSIHAKRTDASVPKTGALAISNIDREMWTHGKVAFRVRSLNGKLVDVNVALSHAVPGGSVKLVGGGNLQVAGRAWRDIVLSLDRDFGFGDCMVSIKQAKIGAWVGKWKSGDEGGIEVRDFRLCGPNDVAISSAFGPKDSFNSVPRAGWRPFGPVPRADALKVFFAFDNEDMVDSVSVREKDIRDRQQFGGFRAVLLEHLDGTVRATDDLDEADVIVYSRCRPDPALAQRIARAVRERGVPMYAASEVCDPEVEDLLPCKIGHEVLEDLPPRARIQAAADGHPLARGPLSDAEFGIYRTIAAKEGARTVLSFANGVPALVEGRAGKGTVIYGMMAIGSSLVTGKESPDAFFVRVLGHLSGRTLPERERRPKGSDAEGWRDGVGQGCFGRFGWETGSGLLVEDVGTCFTVTRGAAGYEFSFPASKDERTRGRAFTFAGDRVNQLSLGGEISIDGTRAARIDMSLGYPGVRWEFHVSRVEMLLKNLLAHAAVPLTNGVAVIDLTEGEEIPHEGWTAPWILLFNASEADSPLMLVFQRRLGGIEVMRGGDSVNGLALSSRGGALGAVVPTWIFGSRTVDTTEWTLGIPREARDRIRRWYPRAFMYPVDCKEKFRLHEDKGLVEILSAYTHVRTADEWRTAPVPYAPVPPVAFALADTVPAGGTRRIFAAERGVENRGLVTRFGDFADKDGVDRVRWALPVFKPDLGFLPHSLGFPEYERIANEQFASGVRFTCGGGVKVDPLKDKHGPGRNAQVYNRNMHSDLHGLCRCTPNPFIYSDENRRLMRRRMTWRMLEPLETMQYKMAARWRREPVSGSVYTIYMNSPRAISTEYDPEAYGSKIIYGDSNETVRMILSCIQVLEDRMGQQGVARANWDAISRHVASYEMVIDDWGILASGCLEYGGPGSIDMLNSEFACMMTLARLSEIAGDDEMRAQALYRASRRMCPTLARLKMRDYFRATGQLADPSAVRASTGFNESGAVFQARGRRVGDIDLFDMSQGIPQDLISLYGWHGWGELRRDYLSDVRAATVTNGLNYIMTAILAIGDDLPRESLAAKLSACAADAALNARLPRDWPGMDTGSYMEFALARLADAPRISDCRGIHLHDARWDRKTGMLTLDFTPGNGAALKVSGHGRDVQVDMSRRGERRQVRVSCVRRGGVVE